MNPWWVSGFIDGEGCFHVSITKNKDDWLVKLSFTINLNEKDIALLEQIKNSFGVSKIYRHSSRAIQLKVQSVKDFRVIINHFDKYPLITQKLKDYLLFKKAFYLISQKEHLTKEGLRKIVVIKASMNQGLTLPPIDIGISWRNSCEEAYSLR